MTFNKTSYFIFGKYYKQIGSSKEHSYRSVKHQKKNLQFFATKLTEKIPDPHNNKEHYQSFVRNKHKISKTIKHSYSATKTLKHC